MKKTVLTLLCLPALAFGKPISDSPAKMDKAVNQYFQEYNDKGLLGVKAEITNCYANNPDKFYCLYLDFTGHFVDGTLAKVKGFPQDAFFSFENMTPRQWFNVYVPHNISKQDAIEHIDQIAQNERFTRKIADKMAETNYDTKGPNYSGSQNTKNELNTAPKPVQAAQNTSTPKTLPKKLPIYRKNKSEATRIIGLMSNVSTDKNNERALTFDTSKVEPLAQKGNVEAQYQLANTYKMLAAFTNPEFGKKSAYWLETAAFNGHYDAQREYCLTAYELQYYGTATYWCHHAHKHPDFKSDTIYNTELNGVLAKLRANGYKID